MTQAFPDGYRELTEIGRGASSVVFRAWQPDLNRWVAIKVVTIAPGTAPLSQFQRERAALGTLSGHPNIVTVHDAGLTPEGTAFIVMEHLQDGTLADRLREGPLPWADAAAASVMLSGALETAHRAGVLHLDVKPENVCRSVDDDTVKLGDFGIASIQGYPQTRSGRVSGTLLHIAPEQLEDQPPTVASDVYSLGSTLFTLVTGHPPFGRPHEAVGVVINRILHEPLPVAELRVLGLPPSLCRIIEQSLARDPHHRQATAAEVGEQLRRAQADAGLVPTQISIRALSALPRPLEPNGRPPSQSDVTLPPAPTPASGDGDSDGDGDLLSPVRRPNVGPKRVASAVGGVLALALVALLLGLVLDDTGDGRPTTPSTGIATTAGGKGQGEQAPTGGLPFQAGQAFVDDFSNPSSGWPDIPNDSYYDGEGGYRVRVLDEGNRLAAGPREDASPVLTALGAPGTNLRLEVDATFPPGGKSGAGLYCRMRQTDKNRYQAVIFPNGHWQITTGNGGPGSIDTLASGNIEALPPGKALHIRLDCGGDGNPTTLSLAVEGRSIWELRHSPGLDTGGLGVVVVTARVPGVDVLFDNFVATRL